MSTGWCAAHPSSPAAWSCPRCGTFVCASCERRTRPDAPPLCPACWELRSATLSAQKKKESDRLPLIGLVLGVLSVLHPLVLVASLVVNVRGLKQTPPDKRGRHVGGLIASAVGALVWAVGLAMLATR